MTPIQLVCLDMAGTTVADDGAVLAAFGRALDDLAVPDADRPAMVRYVTDTMGESKIVVFRALFGAEDRAQQANRAFETAYGEVVDGGGVHPIAGAEAAIASLRASGVKVALLTGFSAPTRDRLVAALGWDHIADTFVCPSEAGRGRPYPDLVLTAILRCGADAVAAVAAVGDTASDMESARRAGVALRVGVRTGTHDDPVLRDAGATHVVDSVADLPGLLAGSSLSPAGG